MKSAHFDLMIDEAARAEVDRTFAAYERMKDVLVGACATRRTDTFQLQRAAYDEIQHETALPARLVTNGIRKYASGAWSKDRLTLDEKRMSFKGGDHVSVATLSACISRLAAGLVALAVESLEGEAPGGVVEQTVGEIDSGVAEIRAWLGNATAERRRYEIQRERLRAEGTTLEADACRALGSGREDLAKARIRRLEDIEVQVGSLDRLIGEVDGRIEEAELAIRAVDAARREMEERVRFARQTRDEAERADPSMRGHPQSVDADPIAAALGVVVGMTDGPAGASRDSAEIEDSGRARRVEDRLAAMRSELGGRR